MVKKERTQNRVKRPIRIPDIFGRKNITDPSFWEGMDDVPPEKNPASRTS
jgi:hypothetical protein